MRIWRNKNPSVVVKKSLIFIMHCLEPFGIFDLLRDNGGFNVTCNCGAKTVPRIQFDNGVLESSCHWMNIGRWWSDNRGRQLNC